MGGTGAEFQQRNTIFIKEVYINSRTQDIISKIKNTLDGFNRLDPVEASISKLESRTTEIMQIDVQSEKRL